MRPNVSPNFFNFYLYTSNIETGGGIFTSLLYDHYSPPSGFCFDGELNYCNDKPINGISINYKEANYNNA